jgi:hypothetical protein
LPSLEAPDWPGKKRVARGILAAISRIDDLPRHKRQFLVRTPRHFRRALRGMLQLRYVLQCGAGFAAIWLGLLTAATSTLAAEDFIEPGQWKVTSTTVINGVVQPTQEKRLCITAE